MKKKLNILTVSYLLFLILLFLSGSTFGILSEVIYLLAFVLPFALALYRTREERVPRASYLTLNSEKISFTLPIIAPTVSVVMLISLLTSLLIFALTGKGNTVDVGDSFFAALLSHALLPAVLEEMLFRYLPMRLLAQHSKRGAVIASAFFFALVHHDLYTIPYSFIAGVIFMTVDIVTDSVIPSVIIHFINNAVSVGLLIYASNSAFAPVIYIILGILTIISICFIFVRKKSYLEKLSLSFDKGEGFKITTEMLIFAGLTLSLAVLSLI